jgi:hypothetical protein
MLTLLSLWRRLGPVRRVFRTLPLFVLIVLLAAGAARATISVYTYFGPGVSWWNEIHEGPGTFGARYYNRVYRPADGLVNQFCLRYHYSDGSYTPWQCNSDQNPFYAYTSSGAHLTAYPAKAQCKYYFPNGTPNQGLNNVTCQTTVGLP